MSVAGVAARSVAAVKTDRQTDRHRQRHTLPREMYVRGIFQWSGMSTGATFKGVCSSRLVDERISFSGHIE
jgi:hypothetical protein